MRALFNILTPKKTGDYIQEIVTVSEGWHDVLSHPDRMGKLGDFANRDIKTPPEWTVPDELKDAEWNISEDDLLQQAPNEMVYSQMIAGKPVDDLVVRKTFDDEGNPSGFSGIPYSGALKEGILGRGYYEGKPTPITVATDVIILEQDKKTGEIYAYLGNRPEFCFAGGIVDEGEDPIDAAVREFFEEVLVASYTMDDDVYKILNGRKWEPNNNEVSLDRRQMICRAIGVPEDFAKAPGIAEFKYKVLQHEHPEAIEEIGNFIRGHTVKTYAGLAKADPRVCERSIFTHAFSMTIDMAEFKNVLSKYHLSMDAEGAEIGKLRKIKLSPEMLIKSGDSPGMFASHGPMLMQALAHQIEIGAVDLKKGKARTQINKLVGAVQKDTKALSLKNKAAGFYSQKKPAS